MSRRRELGQYFTPDDMAAAMFQLAISPAEKAGASHLSDNIVGASVPIRILDPACGEGVFLLAGLREFVSGNQSANGTKRNSADMKGTNQPDMIPSVMARKRLAFVRDSLFGVDCDPVAIERLRLRMRQEILGSLDGDDPVRLAAPFFAEINESRLPQNEDADLHREVETVLRANFVVGDALTGPDFNQSVSPLENFDSASDIRIAAAARESARLIDWGLAFPQVAAAGGFDLVIGNPPYRRERDARDLFETVLRVPFGQRWRQARMDYWHYFLHRGLDLLRPGGTLCFVVNSYWLKSAGASKLRDRLSKETTLHELICLNNSKVFQQVSGWHLIVRLTKERTDADCRILKTTPEDLCRRDFGSMLDDAVRLPHRELFTSHGIQLAPRDDQLQRMERGDLLSRWYNVRQGIAENPPCVTKRMEEESGGELRTGEGVFVLHEAEVETLRLSDEERGLLRPYFETSSIHRYGWEHSEQRWLLYLTRRTIPTLENAPRIAAHLQRFRQWLSRRREVGKNSISWWHLHWPRKESHFIEPRILSPQMGARPQFCYCDPPTFVGFSVNLIVPRQRPLSELDKCYSLLSLTAILNSSIAAAWFTAHAKQRGAQFDLSGGLLRRFPLPKFDEEFNERLHTLSLNRHEQECARNESTDRRSSSAIAATAAEATEELEREIDEIVAAAYAK